MFISQEQFVFGHNAYQSKPVFSVGF